MTALHFPGELQPQALPQLADLAAVLGPQRVQEPHAALIDQAHAATPLRIDALSQELAIPILHLELAFQQTYGMAPRRLVTLHRLAKVRRSLLMQNSPVTEVAMNHGFWHLGRFSKLYKNYYGESPSETKSDTLCGAVKT